MTESRENEIKLRLNDAELDLGRGPAVSRGSRIRWHHHGQLVPPRTPEEEVESRAEAEKWADEIFGPEA